MTSNIIHDIMILYILQQHTGTCVGPILAGQKNFWTESLGETQENSRAAPCHFHSEECLSLPSSVTSVEYGIY